MLHLVLTAALALAPAPPPGPDPARFYPPKREHLLLPPEPVGAGPVKFVAGEGFGVTSKDGRYALALSLRLNFMYSGRRVGAGPYEHAFQIRRLRLVFSGNVFSKHLKFFTQLVLAPRELDVVDGVPRSGPLLDTYVVFDRLRDANLWIGVYRVMYSRERNIAITSPLLIGRSLADSEFALGRDIGVDVRSEDLGGLGKLRYYVGVFMGEGRGQNRFSDPGLMYTARLDFLPFGLFDDYDSSDLTRLRKPRLSLGFAYAFNDRAHDDRGGRGDPPPDGGTTNYHTFTPALMFKWAGFILEAAYLWRDGRRNPGTAVDGMGVPVPVAAPRAGYGWMVQTAFLIPRTNLEPAVRTSGIRGQGVTAMPDRNELGGGLNYYFSGHNLKLQLDYFRTWDRGAPDLAGDLVRLQFQVVL